MLKNLANYKKCSQTGKLGTLTLLDISLPLLSLRSAEARPEHHIYTRRVTDSFQPAHFAVIDHDVVVVRLLVSVHHYCS